MTFASKVKVNLAKQITHNRSSLLAELSAIVRVCGTIKLVSHGVDTYITTENAAVARLVFTLFKKVFKIHTTVTVKKNKSLKRHNIYEVYIENALPILDSLGIIDTSSGLGIREDIPHFILKDDESKRAYIRGLFLGSGSISNPDSFYHLEFVTHNEVFANSIIDLLAYFDVVAKVIKRKSNYVVYIKEGDKIVDVLNIIGAHKTLLSFENTRIIKNVRNKVNRQRNCDVANLNKVVTTSMRQVAKISYLKEHIGLDSLPKHLAEIAELRIEHQELSLSDLGKLLSPPLGKSGINHRLKKLEKIADALMEENNAKFNYTN